MTLHASVAEMLEAAAIDGVLVVAPTDQHGAVIAEVAARGLPILCEKPCGLTIELCQKLAEGLKLSAQPFCGALVRYRRQSTWAANTATKAAVPSSHMRRGAAPCCFPFTL